MQDFHQQHILIGITGGIAAYKIAYLVRELKKRGAIVKIVMTPSATQFVNPLTYQALSGELVYVDLWEKQTAHHMDHIALARWADVFIIAPATADIIAKMAYGYADSLLTTLYLATQAPIILCPAMNPHMWSHPATQTNITVLQARKIFIIPPEHGESVCGEIGQGRLCEPEHLLHYLRLYPIHNILTGQSCVITAGPTQEPLDPVRYLSNHSSGKMGYALAYAAWVAGAKVTLISGPCALAPPPHIKFIQVDTAKTMQQAVLEHLSQNGIFISAAAVTDFSLKTVYTDKMKKNTLKKTPLSLTMNPDIIHDVVLSKKARYIVGFAAETQDIVASAKKKRQQKQLDLMIANDVSQGKAFHQEAQSITLISAYETITLPYLHKTYLAQHIIAWIAKAIGKLT